jgi:hypothetical protein
LTIVAAVVCGLGYVLSRFWALPLGAGAALLAWSWLAPQKKGLMLANGNNDGGSGMILPAIWDEKEVSLGFTRYQDNPNMLGSYVSGIVSRFVVGQDTRTVQTRTAFLEQFNKFAEVARESYKWQRYMNGGRAKFEEDAEDAKAEGVFRRAQADLELGALDTDIQRHQKLLQIERLKRELDELNKPEPPPPPSAPLPLPSPPRQTAAELREQQSRELDERESRVIEQMRITRANPTLSGEQKQRKLNALEDTLAQIHEEQARLL